MEFPPIVPNERMIETERMNNLMQSLISMNLPICGISPANASICPTQYASSFLPRINGLFFRIDWRSEPTPQEREQTLSIICEVYPDIIEEITDSESKEYPPQTSTLQISSSPVLGYYWEQVWIIDKPAFEVDCKNIDLSTIDQLVYEKVFTSGIKIRAYRHGVILFDFSNWSGETSMLPSEKNSQRNFEQIVKQKINRIHVLNAHLLCLYNAISRHENFALQKLYISHQETLSSSAFSEDSSQITPAVSGNSFSKFFSMMSLHFPPNYQTTYSPDLLSSAQTTWFLQKDLRFVVTKAVLDEACDNLSYLLDHSKEYILLIFDILAHACKSLEDHDYNLSLILSWSIIEKILHTKWNEYIESLRDATIKIDGIDYPVMNQNRRKFLFDNQDISAAVIIEFLTMQNILPINFYDRLAIIRKSRNKWLHDLSPVEFKSAIMALTLAQDLLRDLENVHLKVPIVVQLLS